MAGERPTVTRRRADGWDRIKVLLLLGIVIGMGVGSRVNDPFVSFSTALREFRSEPGGRFLVLLFIAEIVRQIHYAFSERWGAYHGFFQNKVWGGIERGMGAYKPWTRFRIGRFGRFIFYAIVYAYAADYLTDDVEGPLQAFTQFPRIALGVIFSPTTLQVVVILGIAILQFAAIFWFLSRGGTDVVLPEEIQTRFDHVWGQDHVLSLVKENIAFLENPDEIEAKGGYIPGGMLLYGPPGTGKTLIAEAIAGETGRPFVFVDPGAFLNMFFGVGVLKVKGLYRKLRKLSLRHGGVIVFFDEADSLGSRGGTVGAPVGATASPLACNGMGYLSSGARRILLSTTDVEAGGVTSAPEGKIRKIVMTGMGGGGMGTLQALLTEMNGLKKPRGFVNRIRKIIGMKPKPAPKYRILHIMASNMPDVLDPALLRPGRIDRIIKVGYPSKQGRKQTFMGYLDKVSHQLTDPQIERLATMMPYYSGAKIKDTVNESLILAIRDGRTTITWDDVIKAKTMKDLGTPDDTRYIEQERRAVAIHEASHAVASHLLQLHEAIDVVSIERRADSLGLVRNLPIEDRHTQWRTELEADVMISIASLAGERMFFGGDNSSGVTADLVHATRLTASMVGAFGMGEDISSFYLIWQDPAGRMSQGVEKTLERRPEQVEQWIKELYRQTQELLTEWRHKVVAVADRLEEKLTITGEEVAEIMGVPPGLRALNVSRGWAQADVAGAPRLGSSPNGEAPSGDSAVSG